ncbi:hypothetical protein AB8E32_00335 [Marinomonas polaris]|uniref:hypothetical protein n=1 Tax=Marinomonas polaris TaxID=293552 RepID=UPI003514A89D
MRFFKCRYWLCKGPQQPHPPLFQLRSFWATVLIPIICAGMVWFLIFKSLDYPDLVATYDGFSQAYAYFKIPLWISALSLPLAGFYASHYRSVQTAAQIMRTDIQITATEQKNAFENCVKHRELFNELIARLSRRYNFEFKDIDLLYSVIFTENDYRSFSFYADEMNSPRYSDSGSYFHQMIDAFEKFKITKNRYDEGMYSYKEALDEFSELPRLLLYVESYNGDSIEELYHEDGRFFDKGEIVYPQEINYFIHAVNELFREFCDFCLSAELAKKYKESKYLKIETSFFHDVLVVQSNYKNRFKCP